MILKAWCLCNIRWWLWRRKIYILEGKIKKQSFMMSFMLTMIRQWIKLLIYCFTERKERYRTSIGKGIRSMNKRDIWLQCCHACGYVNSRREHTEPQVYKEVQVQIQDALKKKRWRRSAVAKPRRGGGGAGSQQRREHQQVHTYRCKHSRQMLRHPAINTQNVCEFHSSKIP